MATYSIIVDQAPSIEAIALAWAQRAHIELSGYAGKQRYENVAFRVKSLGELDSNGSYCNITLKSVEPGFGNEDAGRIGYLENFEPAERKGMFRWHTQEA